jgi:hypothetical protein
MKNLVNGAQVERAGPLGPGKYPDQPVSDCPVEGPLGAEKRLATHVQDSADSPREIAQPAENA